MNPIRLRPARRDEIRSILRIVLDVPEQLAADRERQVSSFMLYVRELFQNSDLYWLAEEDGRCVWACAWLESPGRTAMIFIPARTPRGPDDSTIAHLLGQVIQETGVRDIRIVQSLLQPGDDETAHALLAAGFRELAVLHYLEREVGRLPARPYAHVTDPSIEWLHFDAERRLQFAELILATYAGSQDCRGLAGLRTIDEIMAGHRAAGRYHPHRWLMLREAGRAVGCILLAENPLRPTLEVAYVGVRPESRGRGVGRQLIERAFDLAEREGFTAITLAVDGVNMPARRLYEALGFREMFRRRALIHVRDATSNPD